MRIVNPHLLADKMDDAVTHYIDSHQSNESVHVDTGALSLSGQDDSSGRGVVTLMHSQNYTPICRQVSVGDPVGAEWGEELLDAEGKLAAIVAHLSQHSRPTHHLPPHHKVSSLRSEVDSSVLMDAPMRLFNGPPLEPDHHHHHHHHHHQQQQHQQIVVSVPSLTPLPPLQEMKRCTDNHWFTEKPTKTDLKEDQALLEAVAHTRHQIKKSLPHKKRISKKLKRHASVAPHQLKDIVVIECPEDAEVEGDGEGEGEGVGECGAEGDATPQEEILPDSYAPHPSLHHTEHHITHEVRPTFICQLCGVFYGEEQFKFYQHLKQHYEGHTTIIIENPVPDLAIDKMTNTCIVDNVSALPDSLVELSLESTLPATKASLYHPMKEHILYTSSEKAVLHNKSLYSMSSMDKEHGMDVQDKDDMLYENLDRVEVYSCAKCNATFRKQKHCEMHIKEVHSKLEEMSEFSEPEDLMEGIHVSVGDEGPSGAGAAEGAGPTGGEVGGEEGDQYGDTLLPHITVENGQVHQEHVRHWYLRSGSDAFCAIYPPQSPTHLKEETLQRMFEVGTNGSESTGFSDNLIQEADVPVEGDAEAAGGREVKGETEGEAEAEGGAGAGAGGKMADKKKFECVDCGRVFNHRNSLLYHMLGHKGKRAHVCVECGKGFYTANALKIHTRVHNDDRPHKCQECGRTFRQFGDLKYHHVSIHSDQKCYKCEFCGKEFARKYSLNVHRRIHTGECNYKCDYCNKSFRASSYRLSHMRTHTGEKPHKCTVCDKPFRAGGDLRRHMQIHNKNKDKKVKIKLDKTKSPETVDESEKDIAANEPDRLDADTTKKRSTKKITTMSTTKPAIFKSPEKKPVKKPTKKANGNTKRGYPNVTVKDETKPVQQMEQYDVIKSNYQNGNEQYSKLKEVLIGDTIPENSINNHLYSGKVKGNYVGVEQVSEHYVKSVCVQKVVGSSDRELTSLRPIYRDSVCDVTNATSENKHVYQENTDGKSVMVYTQVEKGPHLHIGDGREAHSEAMESGFLERLTALYNISA